MTSVALLLLLAGCGRPGGAQVPDETGTPGETLSSPCGDLDAPATLDAARRAEVRTFAGLDVHALDGVMALLSEGATTGCPTVTTDSTTSSATVETYTGGCVTAGGVSVDGAVTVTRGASEHTGEWAYALALGVTSTDGALRLDGAASGYEGEAQGWRSWDVTVSSTGAWGFPAAEGAWAGEVAEVGGHVEAQGLERSAGDAVCWVASWDEVDGCGEPEGDEWLYGRTVDHVRWNGAATCDGCGALDVDGVAAGAECAG